MINSKLLYVNQEGDAFKIHSLNGKYVQFSKFEMNYINAAVEMNKKEFLKRFKPFPKLLSMILIYQRNSKRKFSHFERGQLK